MGGKEIFQVVGYQNSGKTTLIENLIKECKKRNLAVGTIKHHGHGGSPARVQTEKDSEKHRLAGAEVVAVEGNGSLFLEAYKTQWELPQIIQIYENIRLDLILIEGYKKENYPKVVLLRNEEDEILLRQLNNVSAVISANHVNTEAFPAFYGQDRINHFIDWFINHYLQKHKD